MKNTPLEDFGLTEWDRAVIAEAQRGTPPNAEEWAIYFRKTEENKSWLQGPL